MTVQRPERTKIHWPTARQSFENALNLFDVRRTVACDDSIGCIAGIEVKGGGNDATSVTHHIHVIGIVAQCADDPRAPLPAPMLAVPIRGVWQKRGAKRLDRAVSCLSDGDDRAQGDVCRRCPVFSSPPPLCTCALFCACAACFQRTGSAARCPPTSRRCHCCGSCAPPAAAPADWCEHILEAFACAHRQECDAELFRRGRFVLDANGRRQSHRVRPIPAPLLHPSTPNRLSLCAVSSRSKGRASVELTVSAMRRRAICLDVVNLCL